MKMDLMSKLAGTPTKIAKQSSNSSKNNSGSKSK
jgi:hypothetical protein